MKIAVKADIYIRACISQRNGIEWTLTLRRSSICVSTRGCLSYRVQLQGSIWCWDRMVPPSVPSVLTKGLVREGHREEEWMGICLLCLITTFSTHILYTFLCQAWVMGQSNFFNWIYSNYLFGNWTKPRQFCFQIANHTANLFLPNMFYLFQPLQHFFFFFF